MVPCPGVIAAPGLRLSEVPPLRLEERDLIESARHEAHVGIAIGATFLLIGEALALGHALDARTPVSLYEITPVVGPAVGLFREQPDTGWATGLVFASWFEAAGIVVLAAAGSYLASTNRFELSASIDHHGGGGSLGMRGRF